ncbi:uncharacterized protein HMPREF1541_07284 [Cyphellophora europaea CBS 101466]|uniref:DnaJ homologue subfamily C member 28 conserved domain-containing protein n=1 Tax=Cyphellophora europaea (strain CBS 101466) TaxID=1220924 RepID=W2RMB3_CYPE1|nr:uncharacterized protein HMPREF1541_07284 [Cyphellophora europaea CBS 101466]ETN37661.1 hypothetical protein HMPREF1541_07284 [Cyphellophora europaea CBS 101466]
MAATCTRLWTCSRCFQMQRRSQVRCRTTARPTARYLSSTPPRAEEKPTERDAPTPTQEEEQGAMSRRLSAMVEESIDTGSKSDRRTMQSASNTFSEQLKAQLEARIAESSFRTENQLAHTEANLPTYAGKGTSSTATAPHWTGSEPVEDAALRMLDDAHKKLRSSPRPPRVPQNVNLRPQPKAKVSQGARLATARDKTSIYAFSQQEDMSEEERERFRKELKDRFSPGVRPMPQTLQGLTSLANERIEDAIARGQFKNIKRGKDVNTQRDYNANSPFLDTTEYFMNKIIQKQEIVPPWIEKQQELAKLVDSFRKRLRSDWRRHAARMIASEGGSLEQQVTRARGYALAEDIVNPRSTERQKMTGISSDGNLVNLTVEDRIAAGIQAEKPEPKVKVELKIERELEDEMQTVASISAATSPTPSNVATTAVSEHTPIPNETPSPSSDSPAPASSPPHQPTRVLPTAHPFRDPAWQRTEHAYHTLAIDEINSFTRSYNLMAPKIAQKPYTNLERELKRCFATVAPQLADEIVERARRPTVKGFGAKADGGGKGVLERVVGSGAREWSGHEGVIRDEGVEKGYGFKQLWRDLFGGQGRRKGKKEREAA